MTTALMKGIEGKDLYEWAVTGSDFYFYQDLGPGRYDEYYFDPDCALLFPESRQVVWFDLDHLTVGPGRNFARRHHPWDLWRKKFAFSSKENQLSLLVYPLGESAVHRLADPRAQESVEVRYLFGEPYRVLCQFDPGGDLRQQEEAQSLLRSAWNSRRRIKIGLHLGKSSLIYPIRTAFREDRGFSFASRTVAIPDLEAPEFSWDRSSVGNVCVSTDGTCSIFRWRKSRWPFRNLLWNCFPHGFSFSLRIFAPSDISWEERIREFLRPSLGRFLSRGLAPFQTEVRKLPFTVYVSEAGEGGK